MQEEKEQNKNPHSTPIVDAGAVVAGRKGLGNRNAYEYRL
jgi:hypothetical protein